MISDQWSSVVSNENFQAESEGQLNDKVAAKSFRDLLVWQCSIQLAPAIYQLTRDFPREELYGLTSQIRRSAVSVASNIAEGQGRNTTGEFRQFLGVARGSNFEIQTQLEIARQLQLGCAQQIDLADALSHEIGKMIYSILEKTKQQIKVN